MIIGRARYAKLQKPRKIVNILAYAFKFCRLHKIFAQKCPKILFDRMNSKKIRFTNICLGETFVYGIFWLDIEIKARYTQKYILKTHYAIKETFYKIFS